MRLLLRLIFLLAWSTAAAPAQNEVGVTGTLTPSTVGAGRIAAFSIRITGAPRADAAPQVSVPGLEIEGPMMQMNQTFSNGRVSAFTDYLFQITTDTPGEYQIPEIEVRVGGQAYKTQPQVLKVTEGTPMPPEYEPKLKLEVGKTEVFEGEVIPLSISLAVHQNTNLTELPFPQLPRDNFAMKRFQRNPDQNIEEQSGNIYRVFTYRTAIHAMKSGDLSLGPAEMRVEALVPDGSGIRDPLGGLSARQHSFKIKSNALAIKVKPLPDAGKPANFSGAVGNFLLQVQAQPTRLMVDDPIAATLYVSGTGNFESLAAPELESTEGWRSYPAKLVQENRQSGLEPGSVAYSQVLMPEKELPALPPFVLNFFNPEIGQYVTVKSDPIPLQIQPNPKKSAAATPSEAASSARDFASTEKAIPKEDLKGVLTVLGSHGAWLDLSCKTPTGSFPAWGIHAAGGGLVLLLAGAGCARRLKARAAARPARTDPVPKSADLLRKLRTETASLRGFYTTAEAFLTAWQREQAKPLPGTGPAAEVANRIRMRHDFFCYGGGGSSDQPVPDSEQREILEALRQF